MKQRDQADVRAAAAEEALFLAVRMTFLPHAASVSK
jgi:hypothetical protein